MLALLPCLKLFSASYQYENLSIEKIHVIMGSSLEVCPNAETIKLKIKTREGDLFSQTEFDNDLKVLAQEFDRVDPELNVINNRIQITLKVWPRPTIRTIAWEGNCKILSSTLQRELGITLCTVFDRLSFNKAFHKLKAYYVKKGFFEAELTYDVHFDRMTNEVDIVVSICEGRSGRIKEIVFCEFTPCEEEDIINMVVTKSYNFFTSWITNEGTYNEDAMQHDHFVILNYLQNEGYADAKVDIEICEAKEKDRIIIYITADRGPIYKCGKLSFTGNRLFCDDDIWNQFCIRENDPFSPESLRETANNIMDFYGRKGFIDCNVNFEPRLNPDCLSYSVEFVIDEGFQYRVGLIKVFGNCTTQTNVILHETLLVPGEIFNADKMRKTEERLKNVGYFSHVNVYAVQSEGPCGLGGNYRDVHIEVEETSTGRFGTFFGYSTIESLFGGVNITEKNFNSAGFSKVFCRGQGYQALRGGGEYAHATVSIGKKSRSYIVSWTKPYFMDTKWSVGFDFERSSNRYISNDYDIEAMGYTLHANYDVNAFVRFGWHYRIRHTRVELSGHEAHADKKLQKASRLGGLISATGFTWSYDSTNDVDKPSCGFKSRFELEYAGLGGDHLFWGVAYLNSYYIPIDKKGVLKIRGDLRFIDPVTPTKFSTIPLDERLFLGGDNTIRGYYSYKLGPRFSKSHQPKGGISMQLFSLEYNRQLFKKMDGFIFLDAGHLSDHRWHFGRLSTSAGFGARIKAFDCLPAICLGMGFPLNPQHRKQVKHFFISFGGKF